MKLGILLIVMLAFAAPALSADDLGPQSGSGPVPMIENFFGYEFDRAYMLTMYQQNADIIGLAAIGMQHNSSMAMKQFSRKIAEERMDMNDDLKQWYSIFMSRIIPCPDMRRIANLREAFTCLRGSEFDCAYASVMIELMKQSWDAADLALYKAWIPQLRIQARVVERTNENEIREFKQFRLTGSLSGRY